MSARSLKGVCVKKEVSSKAIALDPNLAEGYKALGNVYFYKGWMRKALEVQLKAVELNPNYANVVGNMGNTYGQIGNLEEALRWTKKNVALNPTNAYPYYLIGGVYYYLDDFVKAEYFYKKSLELQPDFTFAYQGLTDLYIAQGNCQKAIEEGQHLLSIDPDSSQNLIYAGEAEFFCTNYERAKPYYQKALAVPSPHALIPLGYILWKEGQKQEARKLFNQSLTILNKRLDEGNENPRLPFQIARIYNIQGDKAEAYKRLQKAIDGGWLQYRLALTDPLLENLRNEAKFQEMMTQVKVRVDEMRNRAEKE